MLRVNSVNLEVSLLDELPHVLREGVPVVSLRE